MTTLPGNACLKSPIGDEEHTSFDRQPSPKRRTEELNEKSIHVHGSAEEPSVMHLGNGPFKVNDPIGLK